MVEPKIIKPSIPLPEAKSEEVFEVGTDPILEDSDEKPIENYEKEEKEPYAVKYFGMEFPYYDAEEGPDKEYLQEIDAFVKEELAANNKKPNLRSYRKVLDNLQKRLGVDDDTDPSNVFERISGFVIAYRKVLEIESKTKRNEVMKRLLSYAKDKNFDAKDLKMILQEQYITWLSTNQ